MTERLSRIDNLLKDALEAAREGRWGFRTKVYGSELKRIVKTEKLDVTIYGNGTNRALYDVLVSWSNVFNNEHRKLKEQDDYIKGNIDVIPQTETFAERLYLEAARATWHSRKDGE